MPDATELASAHYSVTVLTEKFVMALAMIAPDRQRFTVAELAAVDQFHTRGLQATKELAMMTAIGPDTRVLDLGCGVGGSARFLAATYGCHVTGVDLSESFIGAATYLTERCGMTDRVKSRVGNALDLPFDAGSLDVVFLQHVAMNIADRASLYAGIARVLAPGGKLATYDVVLKAGDVHYPNPWAQDAAASFLLTADDTRVVLVPAGLDPVIWREDSQLALDWFSSLSSEKPSLAPTLANVLGPDFPVLTDNRSRNLKEGRIGILSAIAERR